MYIPERGIDVLSTRHEKINSKNDSVAMICNHYRSYYVNVIVNSHVTFRSLVEPDAYGSSFIIRQWDIEKSDISNILIFPSIARLHPIAFVTFNLQVGKSELCCAKSLPRYVSRGKT